MIMGAMLKVALEQGFAFLCGLAVVTFIGPTTTGGALLLMVVSIAVINAFRVLYIWIVQRRAAQSSLGVVPRETARQSPTRKGKR